MSVKQTLADFNEQLMTSERIYQSPTKILSKKFYNNLRISSNILRAVNHKLRQRLIYLIDEEESISADQLAYLTGLDKSVITIHIQILRRAKILRPRRIGKNIYYSVVHRQIDKINRVIRELA